CQKCDSAPWTF
nr:immunoglobulin light chain junction region [Macaca mulatta]MOV63949.1 immunoglobulin light chain junction region [Macaca mulatta]MOX08757.1 immunoglobulin light chain junction region [Macaca mulatta]MOX08803.1 immunoglobulin light chain junction region [Macaca mulatta]MOX08834.1 immunoglobulin light chain junction region [Macaca mulatta]